MNYVPTDFDNLEEGFNILDIREENESLYEIEGGFDYKHPQTFNLKQKYMVFADNIYYPLQEHSTKMDFCYIFKGDESSQTGFTLGFETREDAGWVRYDYVDVTNLAHTVTQDSQGNVVWVYEDFDFSGLKVFKEATLILNDRAFVLQSYASRPTEVNSVQFCSFDVYDEDDVQVYVKKVAVPSLNFTIVRKDNISELMTATFTGTFDNSFLGGTNNDVVHMSINYINPKTYESTQVDLIKDVDYTIDGNTIRSGTGSTASAIDVNVQEMYSEGMTFVLYVDTKVNFGTDEDETYNNLPCFNWGRDNDGMFLNINGNLKLNNEKFEKVEVNNAYSSSTEDTYSCDYENKTFSTKGKVLWTNSNASSSFAPQNITLSSSDYDVLEIFYYSSTNTTNSASERIRNKKNTILRWWDASRGKMYERGITYVNDTTLSIGECTIYNVGTYNGNLIPHKIVGYKTGFF